MNTLFVMEKWCDGNPNMGLTNNFHNLLETYKANVNSQMYIAFIDELANLGVDINLAVKEAVKQLKIETIIISFLGQLSINPTSDTFNSLSENIKIIVMWPDLGFKWAYDMIESLERATHIFWDGTEEILKNAKNHKYMWAPQSESLYYPDTKNIEVSFIGSMRQERIIYLQHVLNKGVQIVINGGQREHKLTPEQYAFLIRSSHIGLNFPASGYKEDQFKGRCLEILASKSLLLERANSATRKFLIPGKHYIEFTTPDDLVEKINYYSSNKEKANQISESGYNKYKESYTAKIFWEKVLE